jgi:hypothetical protein
MLNMNPGEPLSLMKKLPCFDNSIELHGLITSVLSICVHDTINFFLLYVFSIDFCRGQFIFLVQSVQERWKIWSKQFNIK